jgi:4-hydroxybenzoyl-CoA thioesterase
MFVSRREILIEWRDCDPADIVYHPNYFAWFDASLMHHFEAAGLPKKQLLARYDLIGWPMIETRAVFHKPSTYGERVTIETRITTFGRTSFQVEQKLFRAPACAARRSGRRSLRDARPGRPRPRRSGKEETVPDTGRSDRAVRDGHQPL